MAFIQTQDGTSLYVNDWGSGRPIVLLHGWPLDADMWEYQAQFLAGHGHRVIAYDRRGFGRSSQPWSGYDYDTLTADLASVLDALDVRDAVLVGFSMGGGEAARYVARNPGGRVARLVLLSSVTPFLLQTPDHPDGVDRSVFDQMVNGLLSDRPHFLANFGKTFFGAGLLNFSISSEILQWAASMALLASPRATVECVRAFSETDFRADLAAIGVPTLIIHGDADQTVPIATSARAAAALIPHAELLEYEGAPHATFFAARDRLNQDLLNFAR